jgi:Resolvase, N terminal domain
MPMSADKIGAQHRARKAVLYVRQSSAHQVQHNRESQVLQYAMRERLVQLGWSEIEVIDDDLGRSAAGGVARAGFERMVAEVCLGKVGAVAARGHRQVVGPMGAFERAIRLPLGSRCDLDARLLPPHPEGFGASTPILSRGHQMPSWTEMAVDHRVG